MQRKLIIGASDFDYLIARAIQFFAPGVPQVYYGGLFACENDMALLAKSNVGRDINRPYLDADFISASLAKPVVKGLLKLIAIRNTHGAFDGEFSVEGSANSCNLKWLKDDNAIELKINFEDREASIIEHNSSAQVFTSLSDLLA